MMREHILPTARMHYYIADGGHAVNVVPGYSKVVFRYRGPSADDVRKNIAWVKDIARGAGLATQTEEKITVITGIYDLVPNTVLADRVTQHLNRYFPIKWTDEEQTFAKSIQKAMGKPEDGMASRVWPTPNIPEAGASTEVGDVSWIAPTMGAAFSAWPLHVPGHSWGCTACHGMSIGRKAVIQAAKVLAAMGLDLFTDPDLLKTSRAEFTKRTNGKPYQSLNVDKAPPGGHLDFAHRHEMDEILQTAIAHLGADAHAS
jgi:aminobenzoyl-glutamate utilization protein B